MSTMAGQPFPSNDNATAEARMPGQADSNRTAEKKTPSQYQHATLYEEWMLQQRKIAANDKNSNGNEKDNYVAAMIARAGQMGALQCAIMDKPPGESSDFLRALLERMELGTDHNFPPLRFPDSMLLDTTTTGSSAQTKKTATKRKNPVSVDVDAFFEAYPECIRPGWDSRDQDESSSSSSSSSSSEDNEEEEQELQPARRKKKPLGKQTTQPAKLPVEHQQEAAQKPAAPPTGTNIQNPYQQASAKTAPGPPQAHYQQQQQHYQNNQSSFLHLKPPQHQHQQQPSHSTNTSRPQPQNYSNQPQSNTQSWEEHYQETNPFQTAREYALATGNHTSRPQQQQQHQRTQPQNHRQPPPRNPYHQQQYQELPPTEEEDPTSPLVQGPVIRESLKRKFQPPKRGATTAAANRETSSKSSSAGASKRIPGDTKRPTSSGSNNSSRKEDEDDDDLPEELKRYGKDMVEKIQNEIMDQGEPITFGDIAGLEHAKTTIQEIVIWPMKRPDLFTGLRRTPNGLLLFGPPGTGKTLIGKAIAHESGATFFSISSSTLTSKWIGEGEKLVRTLFGVAAYHQPAVVFIDEIDSLLTQRKADENEASRRIKTEFLVQLDGTGTSGQGRVLVIGATNRPQELDEAARRRFVKRLLVPLPDTSDRSCLLKVLLEKNQHTLTPADVEKLAADTEGFSGADLKSLCADAAMGPIRQMGTKALDTALEDLPPISSKHFRKSLRGMRPSVSPEDVVQYVEFDKLYGSKRASEEDEDDDEDEEVHD